MLQVTENSHNNTESIRISNNSIEITVIVFSGKDKDFFISYSPSLNTSGYGRTVQEAKESLIVSVKAFIKDLKELPPRKIEPILNSMGWAKIKLKNKNFSHAYIDKDGVIQNLGLEDIQVTEEEMSF